VASTKQGGSNELKNRFDNFHREARYEGKPYRMLGRPQIANKHINVLIAYPAQENTGDRAAFAEAVTKQLKEYGLDPDQPTLQKTGVRIQARLLVIEAPSTESSEA
jgi:hypothetical protein